MLRKRILPMVAAILASQLSHSALVTNESWGRDGSQSSIALFLFNESGTFVVDTGQLAGQYDSFYVGAPEIYIELNSLAGFDAFGEIDSFAVVGVYDRSVGDSAYSYSEFVYYDPTIGIVYASDQRRTGCCNFSSTEQVHIELLSSFFDAEGYSEDSAEDFFSGTYSLNGGPEIERFGNLLNAPGNRLVWYASTRLIGSAIENPYWISIEDDVFQVVVTPLPAASWFFISGIAGLTALKRKAISDSS